MLRAWLLSFLLLSVSGHASQRWHWEDRFSPEERRNLIAWVEYAHAGLAGLIGELPYSYDVHFHRRTRSSEPVPWANTTKRWNRRGVNFHVDPRFPRRDFERDWTAYHELAHLMFPYLGRSGMWFAEGIASYLQYQAMYAAGELDWAQVIDRYRDRFDRASRSNRLDSVSIVDLNGMMRQTRSYVRLYWGGAAFFLEADRRLHRGYGIRLHDVIRDYLDCCFGSRDDGPMEMIRRFDRLSGSRVFSEVYADTVDRKGFPETEAALAWLRDHPPRL
ncbi:MAG: hypothetical protein R3200_02555 [Xanthomonadales bacterium]|nr:hypothetical protein [Xanthomonadales bacterium]